MDGAKNVSRLGGLTVAVGLGFAVSSGQGVAYADTDSSDSGSTGSSVSSGASDTDSAASADFEQREQPTRRGKIRIPGRDAESAAPGDAPRRELSPRRLKIREALRSADESAESSTDQATGKLADAAPDRAVAKDSPSSVAVDPTATVDSVPDLSEVESPTAVDPSTLADADAPAEPELVEPVEPVELVEPVEPVEPSGEATAPEPQPQPETGSTPVDEASDDSAVDEPEGANQRDEAARELGAASNPGDATAEPTGTTVSLDVVAPEAVINPLLAAQVSSQTEPMTLTGRPAFHPIVELLAVPLRIVTGLLGLVGLAPGATVPGAPVSPVTKLLELAWVALRRVNSFFFNSTPTATVTLDQPTNSSVITGRVVGYDPDGDPLEYRVVEQPTHGAVQLNTDGSFTYTPTAAGIALGADSFRVAVVDKGFHFHGLLGFLKPAGGHRTVAEVTLNLAPGNTAPIIERLTTTITDNGAVGTVRITDDGDNPLNVGVSQTTSGWGSVTIAHLEDDTWQWTLTAPAGRPPEDVQVAFAITASDGLMTRTQAVEVTVPAPSWVVVDTTVIHLPTTVVVSPLPPIAVTSPDGELVVNWNHNLYIADPDTGIASDISLPANTIVSTSQIVGELIVIDSDLTVSTGELIGSQLVINPTGITLTETPTSMTTVGGSLVLGGGLVTTTDTKLTVYGRDNLPAEFSGSDIFGADATFKEVTVVGDSGNVAVTSQHRMSFLQTAFNLGGRAMSGDAPQSTVGVEVVSTVDFGDGVIGALAARGESVYVTVTEGDVTRLIKYDAYYYGLEEQSSVELGGSVSGLAISEDGSFAYVADNAAGTVTIVAIQDYYYGMDVIDIVPTGPGHVSALSGGRLAVTDPGSGTVTVIQLD